MLAKLSENTPYQDVHVWHLNFQGSVLWVAKM